MKWTFSLLVMLVSSSALALQPTSPARVSGTAARTDKGARTRIWISSFVLWNTAPHERGKASLTKPSLSNLGPRER